MNIEPTDFDVNTDDLDAFTDHFNGKAPEVKTEEEKAPEVVEALDEDKTDETESNDTPEPQDDDPDLDEDKEKVEEKPAKKVNRFQERINELTAKAREAERALEALKAEQAQKQKEPTKEAAPTPVDDGPNPDEKNADGELKYPLGEFDPNYIRDLTRHTIQKESAAAKAADEQAQAQRFEQEARDSLHNQWVEKLAPVQETHEDFLDKTIELEQTFEGLDPGYSDYLVQTIKSLDHGPEVLYYFANNLEEAQRFVKLGPLAATLALGEYNALFKKSASKEKRVSNAPPPPQVNKGTKTRTVVNADTDDLDAFASLLFQKDKK